MGIDMIELGSCVRSIREAAGLTSDELARQANIASTQTITRLETGRILNPTYENLDKLLTAICRLNVIKTKQFRFDNYSQDIISIFDRYAIYEGNTVKEAATELKTKIHDEYADELANMSKSDLQQALMHMYLERDMANVDKHLYSLIDDLSKYYDKTTDIDYCPMLCAALSDLAKNNILYKAINEQLNDMINKKGCIRPFKFIDIFIVFINLAILTGAYGDKHKD